MVVSAVVFDLGGVVTESPFPVFAQLEREWGLPAGVIADMIRAGGNDGPWAQIERGELTSAGFDTAFAQVAAERGLVVDGLELLRRVDGAMTVREAWLSAITQLRGRGLRVAALTNNWSSEAQEQRRRALAPRFDVFVESFRLGMRKPEIRIYQHVCAELCLPASELLFLDDLGTNLKTARHLGTRTLKVVDAEQGLAALHEALAHAD